MSHILYPPPDVSSLNIVPTLWPIEHVQKKEIGKSEIFSKFYKNNNSKSYEKITELFNFFFTKMNFNKCLTLPEKCPYWEFFWSVFSRIWTEYGEIRSISLYLVRIRDNTYQKNSGCGHFWKTTVL